MKSDPVLCNYRAGVEAADITAFQATNERVGAAKVSALAIAYAPLEIDTSQSHTHENLGSTANNPIEKSYFRRLSALYLKIFPRLVCSNNEPNATSEIKASKD